MMGAAGGQSSRFPAGQRAGFGRRASTLGADTFRKFASSALLTVCCLFAPLGCKSAPVAWVAPGISGSSPSRHGVGQGSTGQTGFSDAHEPRVGASGPNLAWGEGVGCAIVDAGMPNWVPGSVLCWGDTSAWSGAPTALREVMPPAVVPGPANIVELAGSRSICARSVEGNVWCWGAQPGSFGTSSAASIGPFTVSGPTPVAGAKGAVALAVGNTTACVVTSEGKVRCWGDNFQGTVGDGTNEKHQEPIDVDVGLFAVGVALDEYNGCAWDKQGSVSCWGRWDTNSPQSPFRKPTVVTQIPGMAKLILRGGYRCALTRDHSVSCWTGNEFKNALTVGSTSLAPVPALNDAVDVDGTLGFICALRQTGQLRCWSTGPRGGLPGETRVPSQLGAHDLAQPTHVVAFVAGDGALCARLKDASVVCWGSGTFGELGDGQASVRDEPAPIVLPNSANHRAHAAPAPSRICHQDEGCRWDRTDKPTACVAHPDGTQSDRAAPKLPTGSCSCLANHCTWLYPSVSNGAQTTCLDYSDCRYDTENGSCRSRTNSDRDSVSSSLKPGPFCDCKSGTCELIQVQPVSCQTDKDCWFSEDHPHRPIRRPAPLREHKFRPCVDGEVPPRCMGVCGFGMPYKC